MIAEKSSQKHVQDEKKIHSILSVANISYYYEKDNPVLSNVSLEVKDHEILAIAGPNGSGKTTLVKHLNGLIKPIAGKIFYKGKEIQDPRELMKKVGLVFQNPDDQVFFPIVEEDIAFGPRNMGLTHEEIKVHVENALTLMQISHLKHRSYYTLSFGERKKVAIAGILAMNPEIIILDEPTIGFDPWSKKTFIELIKRMKSSLTIVLVSHDPDLLKIADRILFLNEGKIEGEYYDFAVFKQETMI